MITQQAPAYKWNMLALKKKHAMLQSELRTNRVKTQNSQRQETPALLMYPPTMGPRHGPAKGASAKIAKALPRVPASHMSAMTPL